MPRPVKLTIELPARLASSGEWAEGTDEAAYPVLESMCLYEAEAMALRAVRAAVLALEENR